MIQFIIFKFCLFPFHRQQVILKICIITDILFRNIFHQAAQSFTNFLKFMNARPFHVIGIQNLLNQVPLRLYFRYIRHIRNSANPFHQIAPCSSMRFPCQIRQFDPIHQRVKTHRTGFFLVRLNQRSNLLSYKQCVCIIQTLIPFFRCIQIHIFQMLFYRKTPSFQLLHLCAHLFHKRISVGSQMIRLIFKRLKLVGNIKFQTENSSLKSHCIHCCFSFVQTEKFKISTKIKNIEFCFIFSVHQHRTESGSPADHLPELCPAHHLFEKDQIQHFRNIDSCIQHIYRYRDLRHFSRLGKFINGVLRIGHVIVNDFRKIRQMRIFFQKNLMNFFRMIMIFCKNNGLSKPLTIIHFQTIGHKNMERLPNRIFIENPGIQRSGTDTFRYFTIFISEGFLVCLPILLRQFLIDDSLFHELQSAFHGKIVYQIAVLHCLRQIIAIGRNPVFQFKNFIGIFINLIFRSRRQPDERRVKPIENILVFVVYRPVHLITDHKVKISAGKEPALSVIDHINAMDHGLIRGKYTMGCIIILFLHQIGTGKAREQIHKASLRLCDQRIAIRQKQNIFDPSRIQQRLAQRNHGSRLPGTGCHNQKRFSPILSIKTVTDCPDRRFLIIASCDLPVCRHMSKTRPHSQKIKPFFQISFGIDRSACSFRILPVQDMRLKTIGQKNYRLPMIFLFHDIRIKLCLLTSFGYIHTGTFCLDHGKRPVHVIIQYIICTSRFRSIGHARELHFVQPVIPFRPAGFPKHRIYVQLPG